MATCFGTYECPVDGCDRRTPWHLPVCSMHWQRVELGLKRAILRAWRGGASFATDRCSAPLAHALIEIERG